MDATVVVLVQVERGPPEVLRLRGRQAVRQPAGQHLDDVGVRVGRLGQVDVARAVPEQTQRVRPHPGHVLLHHIQAGHVAREAPVAQHREDVALRDGPLLLLAIRHDLLRLPLRHQAVRPHQDRLASELVRDEIDVAQAVLLAELLLVPAHHGLVHERELGVVPELHDIDGILAQPAGDPDVAPLDVPAPVHRPGPELQGLAHGPRLAVALVAHVALGAGRLRMGPVLQLRLRLEAGDQLERLVAVARVALRPRILHVLRLGPLLLHADLVLLPLLGGHRRGLLGLPQAFDVSLPRRALDGRLDDLLGRLLAAQRLRRLLRHCLLRRHAARPGCGAGLGWAGPRLP
mmetsp:Transcript_74677/g.218798  ORF Transcript_74677/g.218798 Transcript_74677/m.218798 type:complete len:346 (+) Transcript_74677:543-1580(+)